MNQLVSIIVPVYNIEAYIEKCLQSILSQTYQNIEIIIIDDGSTDGSGKICDDFQKIDSRIKVYHRDNFGLSATRNFGIKKSKGNLIAFIDGDDSVEPEYIERLVTSLRDDIDIVVCGYSEITSQNQKKTIMPQKQILSGIAATTQLLVGQDNIDIVAWNKLYRKTLFTTNNISYPEGDIFEDTLTTYKIYSCSKKIAYNNYPLYNYYRRANSITNKAKTTQGFAAKNRAAREAKDYFRNNNQKLQQAATISELLSHLSYIDAAIAGRVNKNFFTQSRKWILEHSSELKDNIFLPLKPRFYIFLIKPFNGALYKLFRKIKH